MNFRRGFTLVEMSMVMGIILVLASIGAFALGRLKDPQSSENLANLLATRIRAERMQAMSEGEPRGLVFSTLGQSTSLHKAAVVISGYDKPTVVRALPLAQDVKELVVFSGYPDGSGEEPSKSVLANGVFEPSKWLPQAYQTEKALIFLPNGDISAHGLKLKNGDFWFVSSLGAELAAGQSPSHRLLKAGSPYSVTVSQVGMVKVTAGAPDTDTSARKLGLPANVGELSQPVSRSKDFSPEFAIPAHKDSSLAIQPKPENGNLPSGVTTTLFPEDILHFETFAKDQDGDDLAVRWSVDPHAGNQSSGEGSYSSFERKMGYDLGLGVKTHTTAWRPPPDARPGDTYRLTVELDDGTGKVTQSTDAQIQDVMVVASGRIIYTIGPTKNEVMGLDGSKRGTVDIDQLWRASLSGDGTRYATGSHRNAPPLPGNAPAQAGWSLITGYVDGPEVLDIGAKYDFQISAPTISPGGEKVAFIGRSRSRPNKKMSDPYYLYTVNFDGTELEELRDGSGQRVLAGHHSSRANILMAESEDFVYGPPLDPGQGTFGKVNSCAWSPDGNTILFPRSKGDWDGMGAGIGRYDRKTKQVSWFREPSYPDGGFPGSQTDYYAPSWGYGNKVCFIREEKHSSRVVVVDMVTGAQKTFDDPKHSARVFPSPLSPDEFFVGGWSAAGGDNGVFRLKSNGEVTRMPTVPADHIYGVVVTR